jgi:hypothetical protein
MGPIIPLPPRSSQLFLHGGPCAKVSEGTMTNRHKKRRKFLAIENPEVKMISLQLSAISFQGKFFS